MNFIDGKKNGQAENVRVFVRIRPLSQHDLQGSRRSISPEADNQSIRLNNFEFKEHEKLFQFHHVFSGEMNQLEIYQHVAAPIVDRVIQGFNGTIFAYGQTGSGKTFTMVGRNSPQHLQGIIPNSFSHIFGQISKSAKFKSFIVTATFLEIYNEEIRDLLTTNLKKKLTIHEHKSYGPFVKNLSVYNVNSLEEMIKVFTRGNKNRTTKSNTVNSNSSRSHAIFTIMIESKDQNSNETTFGKLNFVDLAGSERLNRTNASGDMLKEATHINLSLSVLGNVISSLVDEKSSHIPYRNSKLTRLLQDSLGGNSKTAMIAAISSAENDYDESVCTLRYASRVKNIENFVSINKKDEGLISSFEKQIQDLQGKLEVITNQQSQKQITQFDLRIKSDEKRIIKEELLKTELEKKELVNKIDLIKEKIIVGGVNLLDKVEEQNFHLMQISTELLNLNSHNQILEKTLDEKNNAKYELKEKNISLQVENEVLDEKIRKVEEELQKYEQEKRQYHTEHQFEIDRILEEKKAIMNDIGLHNIVIENYIPEIYRQKIESNIHYHDKADEFRVRNIAYAGNHIDRKYIEREHLKRPVARKMRQPYIKQRKG